MKRRFVAGLAFATMPLVSCSAQEAPIHKSPAAHVAGVNNQFEGQVRAEHARLVSILPTVGQTAVNKLVTLVQSRGTFARDLSQADDTKRVRYTKIDTDGTSYSAEVMSDKDAKTAKLSDVSYLSIAILNPAHPDENRLIYDGNEIQIYGSANGKQPIDGKADSILGYTKPTETELRALQAKFDGAFLIAADNAALAAAGAKAQHDYAQAVTVLER